MKKVLLIVCLLTFGFSAFSQTAKSIKEKKFSLQTSPILFLYDMVFISTTKSYDKFFFWGDLEFQYAINPRFTLTIQPNLRLNIPLAPPITLISTQNYGIENQTKLSVGILFKPFASGIRGMYVGFQPAFSWLNITQQLYHSYSDNWLYYSYIENITDNFYTVGFTVSSGYQWVFQNGFTVSLGGGIGKTFLIPFKNNTLHNYSTNNIDILLNFKLGYSF